MRKSREFRVVIWLLYRCYIVVIYLLYNCYLIVVPSLHKRSLARTFSDGRTEVQVTASVGDASHISSSPNPVRKSMSSQQARTCFNGATRFVCKLSCNRQHHGLQGHCATLLRKFQIDALSISSCPGLVSRRQKLQQVALACQTAASP